MSRIARKPLNIPAGVTIQQQENVLTIKGKKGSSSIGIHRAVNVAIENNLINISLRDNCDDDKSVLGTTVVLLKNVIKGVDEGFEIKMQLVGVGYRAKVQGNQLELSLGYSHPVIYSIPNGVVIETPSNTDLVIKGISKELIGQTAAEIRRFRAPESYKGKGIRYFGENIILKETKKK